MERSIRILSWNVSSLLTRVTDVHYFVLKNNIDVVCLQETRDTKGDTLKLNGYRAYHLHAGDRIRGVSTYVKSSIPSELTETPCRTNGIESVCVKLHLQQGEMYIVNLYISGRSFDLRYLPDCMYSDSALIVGDLNARHPQLEERGNINDNGKRFYQFLKDRPDACLLGGKEATHIKGGRLDYACLLGRQAIQGECKVVSELLSDHFALYVKLAVGKIQVKFQRKRLSLNVNDRDQFVYNIENWYKHYTPICLDRFNRDLLSAIERCLPTTPKTHRKEKGHGGRKNRYCSDKTLKEWTYMLRLAHREWVQKGKKEQDRDILLDISRMCGEKRKEVREKYWKEFAQNIEECKSLKEIWHHVNKVRGKTNNLIGHPHPEEEANKHIQKWAKASSLVSLPQHTRDALDAWEIERKEQIQSSLNITAVSCQTITIHELLNAIKRGKSTSPGEDGVTYDILNALVSMENSPLLDLFNMSYLEGRLPKAWKKALIIPIPKSSGGYRPVSLTSCLCKMMERILLNRLMYVIGDKLSCNLYGFMKGKGTSDCLIQCLSNDAEKCRVFVDLQGAFDKANGEVIMYELAMLGVTGTLLKWIGDYLSERRACVWFQGCLSEEKNLELGTPQGGVLSPTLFNVLMNRIASESYPQGVQPIIYADDILIQGTTQRRLQTALNNFSKLAQTLGLVINEEKTKFQSKQRGNVRLSLNDKQVEKVLTYKYLGVYIGFTASSKDAEVNHILTQCRARLRPLRALACRGVGAGVPLLRLIYISTIRALVDYAAPALSIACQGRLRKLETIQNEAMRIILGCQRNTRIDIMRAETGLQSIVQRVREINAIAAIRLMRGTSGKKLVRDMASGFNNMRSFYRQGKRGYMKELRNSIQCYGLKDYCHSHQTPPKVPPWEDQDINIDVDPLSMNKSMYEPGQLKATYSHKINSLTRLDIAHVYCDGSVLEDGRAGCGVIIRQFTGSGVVTTSTGMRLSNHISSTQAELWAILTALKEIEIINKDSYFFVDSRGALDSLNSKNPVFDHIVGECRLIAHRLRGQGRVIAFVWIPSHVGVTFNEAVDEIAKGATRKHEVDIHCMRTLKQAKSNIKRTQLDYDEARKGEAIRKSDTLRHYMHLATNTDFAYGKGKSKWKDSVYMRIRLGYKYYWELGVPASEKEKECRVCSLPRSHTLTHYILQCSMLQTHRNAEITGLPEQAVWMIRNGQVFEILKRYRQFAPIS